MSRIKTIEICLKLFSARLRELSVSCRITGSRFWLIVLLSGLLAPACAPLVRLGGSIEGFENRGVEFDNIRFKPIGLDLEVEGEVEGTTISVPPVPALSYWLRRGDLMGPDGTLLRSTGNAREHRAVSLTIRPPRIVRYAIGVIFSHQPHQVYAMTWPKFRSVNL
jgi:hypothetical protein